MKRLIIHTVIILGAVVSLLGTAGADATMKKYCSAPPFVTRTVTPNIMILMDNSQDMLTSAYETTYNPTSTKDNYVGYFNPQGCYAYSSNKFVEKLKTVSATVGGDEYGLSYSYTDTCPSTAPFRGNLLNWATMSKFDVLQKVIVGGNSASKQGNAHTLVSISGTWEKLYDGCYFSVSSGNLMVSEATADACKLLDNTPIAFRDRPAVRTVLAWLRKFGAGVATTVSAAWDGVKEGVTALWDRIELVKEAYAAQLEITTTTSLEGTVGTLFSFTLEGSGSNNCTYVWSFTPGTPATWLTTGPTYATQGNKRNYRVTWSGTPTVAGDYYFNVTVSASGHTPRTINGMKITIKNPPLRILTSSLLEGEQSSPYSFTLQSEGGTPGYVWTWAAASGSSIPPGLTLSSTGVISGTPSTLGTFNVLITVKDSAAPQGVVTQAFSLVVSKKTRPGQANFNVKVQLTEEPLTDLNGNDIYDDDVVGEEYTDYNDNGKWDGKKGVFQQFWDMNNPRARWGMAKFGKRGSTTVVDIDACIPASPASSFYTRVQNATATDNSPLAQGLYGVVNYFAFTGTGYEGCNNSDPIDDDVPCRKNFILVISSGSNVSGPALPTQTKCSYLNSTTDPLRYNACYGYNTDLRPDASTTPPGREGKQYTYTYVVNPTSDGGPNKAILEAAAVTDGGGKYYDVQTYGSLESALIRAIQDILAQAASGTAVSVLTTSSRGVGSVVQAYFLPSTQENTRNIWWTGYLKNIWIDTKDNLREDSQSPLTLDLDSADDPANGDKVMKLFYNPISHETEVALFTTKADGTGGSLESCSTTDRKAFGQSTALWEAGQKLADRLPDDRSEIFTAAKVMRTTGTTSGSSWTTAAYSFSESPYPRFNRATMGSSGSNETLKTALNKDVVYSVWTPFDSEDKIIDYIKGWCLETKNFNTSTGACDASADPPLDGAYRDRRLNSKVWKLGDIISSTPKVLATTPQNTYHIDYGDTTYYTFVSSDAYRKRSSVAFVGANDGMLHAFRVGYLKDTGIDIIESIKAKFQNFSDSTSTTELGKEMWAYVPFNALPYLKYFGNSDYCHIYYSDLSVRLVDASINGLPGDVRPVNGSSWKTILLGGMRYGGACGTGDAVPNPPDITDGSGNPVTVGFSSFFAIDVTDAEHPVPLWEFSDEDMGYSTTFPAVLRTGNAGANGNWYVAIGAGSRVLPKSGIDIHRTTNGYVYLLDLETGSLVRKVSISHAGIVGDILSIDADKDYHSEKLYFGTSYCTSFNASGFCNTAYRGKLMSIAIPEEELTATSTLTLEALFEGNYPFTASPDAAKDEYGKVWVFAGSGKYFSDMDEEDQSQQVFLGFNDTDTTGAVTISSTATISSPCDSPCPTTGNQLCNVTNCTTTGTIGATVKACLYNSATDSFANQDVVTTISGTAQSPKSTYGWFHFLPDRQKMISRPLAVGGLVDFLTYRPTGDPCYYGGESYLYAVNYTTGTAPLNVAIRHPGATTTSGGISTVNKGVLLGPGAPPTGEAIILPPPKDSKETLEKKIQIATGVIVETQNKPQIDVRSKVITWLKK